MYCIRSAAFGSSKTNLFEVILYIIETFVPILRSYRVQKHTINKIKYCLEINRQRFLCVIKCTQKQFNY